MQTRPAGLLLDLDGTVWEEEGLIPGADEAVAALRAANVPLRFVTNITRVPRQTLAGWLTEFGVPAVADDVFTPPLAAVAWLRERGVNRVFLCLPEHAHVEFDDFVIDSELPGAVVVGDLGAGWTYEILNDAFNRILDGAEFLALHRNRYWKTGGGLAVDAGAFVAALEYASRREATLVGKPSQALYHSAATSIGLRVEEVAMVGDTLESDITGAKRVGCQAILVRTGKFDEDELVQSKVQPDLVVESIADLPELFKR
jgi:HAD superfamily hydrolase (TIGR01458 family)